MRFTVALLSIHIFTILCSSVQAQQATGTIDGRVLDSANRQPLQGVNITVAATESGTTTDATGIFRLGQLPAGSYTLQFSYVGYADKSLANVRVTTGRSNDLGEILLREDAIDISEIVVTPGRFSIMGNEPVSRQTLTSEDIKNMSWAEDITRAVARLPGVSSNDFSSKFTVRGGESDEVLIALDGMELYEPFHQRDFAGGLFSIVDIEAVQGVDLLTGGFGVEYGNRTSGVFNMQSKRVNPGQRRTSVGLSVMNARIYSEGGFAGEKGSYLISARRGMLDALFKLVDQTENLPAFYDAFAKAEYALNDRHRLSIHALHSGDNTKIRDIADNINFDIHDTDYASSYGWLTLKSVFSPQLYTQNLLYSGLISHNRRGNFEKNDFTDKGEFTISDKRDYSFLGFKQDWNAQISGSLLLQSGFEIKQLNADYNYQHSITDWRITSADTLTNFNREINLQSKPSGQQGSAYLSSRFKLLPKLAVETGIRYDHSSYSNDDLWSPRVNVALALAKKTFLRGGWGYYYQSQFINNLDVNHGDITFNPAELSRQYVLGLEHEFFNGVQMRVEGYYKDLSNLSPVWQNLRDPWEVYPEARNDNVKLNLNGATSRGIEIFLKYDLGRKISWWFSYALAQAQDDIAGFEFDGLLTERIGTVPRLNDQRHTVYADVNYRPSKPWHFNLSWQFYTGWPRTNYSYASQVLPNGERHFYQIHEEFNGVRYTPYHRMDLRTNRQFNSGWGRINTFLHLINLYNRPNMRKFDLDVERDAQGNFFHPRDDKTWFGFIPVIGMSMEF